MLHGYILTSRTLSRVVCLAEEQFASLWLCLLFDFMSTWCLQNKFVCRDYLFQSEFCVFLFGSLQWDESYSQTIQLVCDTLLPVLPLGGGRLPSRCLDSTLIRSRVTSSISKTGCHKKAHGELLRKMCQILFIKKKTNKKIYKTSRFFLAIT